ncbi:hypothetical protein ABZ807_29065 [Micromonospora sp. NPDC047548]|uniref:hypothetical protein n=1 Tax=Micromonospora sp. NPDC047548 TaxID=3155624 RepID=UPI0033EE764D
MTDVTRDHDDEPMTDVELQDAAQHLGERFEDHDKRFLALMTAQERAAHYQALWMLYQHVDRIWEAPKRAGGPHPVELGDYGAVAGLRDLFDQLLSHVQDVQCTVEDESGRYRARMVVEDLGS